MRKFLFTVLFAISLLLPINAGAVTTKIAAGTGSAAALVTITIAHSANKNIYLYSYYANCNPATGATTDSSITLGGLTGGTITVPFHQSTNSFIPLQDILPVVPATNQSTDVVLTIPAMTNGGACYGYMTYVQQ